jgi:hypothetical protein
MDQNFNEMEYYNQNVNYTRCTQCGFYGHITKECKILKVARYFIFAQNLRQYQNQMKSNAPVKPIETSYNEGIDDVNYLESSKVTNYNDENENLILTEDMGINNEMMHATTSVNVSEEISGNSEEEELKDDDVMEKYEELDVNEEKEVCVTLRSGRHLKDNTLEASTENDEKVNNEEELGELKEQVNEDEIEMNEDKEEEEKELELKSKKENQEQVAIPYPKRLEVKDKPYLDNIRKIFEKVQVNIPLLELIKEVPPCAKFLKDFCTKKRHRKVSSKALVVDMVNSLCLADPPKKLNDPGTPVISCNIGEHFLNRVLIDLGAGINVMPSATYDMLALGGLMPTKVIIQLADRSLRYPIGELRDVSIKIKEFTYKIDFIILETNKVGNDRHVSVIPLILGRPFLATAGAVINCRNGDMKLMNGTNHIKLNIFQKEINNNEENERDFMEISFNERVEFEENELDEMIITQLKTKWDGVLIENEDGDRKSNTQMFETFSMESKENHQAKSLTLELKPTNRFKVCIFR